MTSRPLIVVAQFILALAVALILAATALGTPPGALVTLSVVLSVTGAASLLAGAAAVRLSSGRVGSVRLRVVLAIGTGLVIALVNVFVAATLMLLDGQDLPLFALMLAFAGVISLAFGFSVATALMHELEALGRVAERLANGDLGARAGRIGSGEVARLAEMFDYMADQVQAAQARERELEASRRDLLAAVSHDLRTPLAATRAMVEAITEGVISDPAEVQHYLGVIRGEVRHLERLIDDLFEISRIESGALELQRILTNVSELVTETLAVYQTQARERGIALEYAIDAHLRHILADPQQLQRAFGYVIANVLRQAPDEGSVSVAVRAAGSEVRLSVSRSGSSAESEDMERVFDPFYRREPARSRPSGEVDDAADGGLTLALARGLVLAHGGRIWAERSGGVGPVFHITIPFVAE